MPCLALLPKPFSARAQFSSRRRSFRWSPSGEPHRPLTSTAIAPRPPDKLQLRVRYKCLINELACNGGWPLKGRSIEMGSDGGHLPVIDMAEGRERMVDQVEAACRSWGGFQVMNHGVAMRTVDDARAQSRLLFALPSAQKLKVKRMPGEFTGYGNGAVVNSETLNEEYYSEAITLGYRSLDAASVSGKLWPEGNPAFSKSVAEFSVAAHELSLEILGCMVDGLPVASREHFREYLAEQSGTLRVNNYPLCPQPALHTGLPPHIDACVVTVLHQSADVAGLEVEKDGSWIGVQPQHDALVVIVGAIVQVLTNGIYKAVNHRALLNAERSRLSLAYSVYPPSNVEIVPAQEFVSCYKPSPYRPFSWADFLAAKQKHVTNPLLGLLAKSPGVPTLR